MTISYTSTRDANVHVTASHAVLQGLSTDGGLFVPEQLPDVNFDFEAMSKMSYQEVAYIVMQAFLSDYTEAELRDCIARAYDDKFDTEAIAPLVKVGDEYVLELFHGPTLAFKDMALSILPHLMTTAGKKNNLTHDIIILTATSGDTGKAAMAGFADVPNTRIIVFYPKDGVSPLQERQMLTQKGENTYVVGIEGNFDDAQTNVKAIFNNKELNKKLAENDLQFSSANSINIGRLVPQIAYYVYAYVQLIAQDAIKSGDLINVSVPTGNFGNILAAYYAKQIGLPIDRLICASNENNVLSDFFATGTYDKNRQFYVTSSPSMDILISSNLERLIYHLTGNNSETTKDMMSSLTETGKYSISNEMRENIKEFYANYTTEKEVTDEIRDTFVGNSYTFDPHTAVASDVYKKFKTSEQDLKPAVIVSTANPYKFANVVLEAVEGKDVSGTDFEIAQELEKATHVTMPQSVKTLFSAPILHDTNIPTKEMQSCVESILEINE